MQNYPIMFLTVLASVLVYKGSDNGWYGGAMFCAGWALATAVNQILLWLNRNGSIFYTGLTMQMEDIRKRLPPDNK